MWGSMRKILGCKDSDILGTVIIHSWINCDWFDLITLPLCYFIGIKQSHEEILYKIPYLIISGRLHRLQLTCFYVKKWHQLKSRAT